MIDQLRRDLDQVNSWVEYRETLKKFRKSYGPPFEGLAPYAVQRLGIKAPPSKTAFFELTKSLAEPPDWPKVSLMVKTCVLWADEHPEKHPEDLHGIRTHLEEIQALWKAAFLRLGGQVPHKPTAGPLAARWTTGRDRIRQLPKKLTVPVAVLVLAGLGLGGYALITMDQDKGRTVEAAEATPKSKPSTDDATPSPSPASPTTTDGSTGTVPGGSTTAGTESEGPDSTADASPGSSAGVEASGTSGGSSGGTTTQTQRYVAAKIEWSNDVDGNPDPKDPKAIVKVYDSYKDSAGTSVHQYYRTDSIRVKCQVTGGREFALGDFYNGPEPRRHGIWYLMDTGEWAPAVFVDTGKPSLPACATS
ncbi:hypothetical protein ACFUIT_39775 [Streptomyces sp. NPDC057239]|uniref:hypothetical protein n=1 Tax=Streptomyces sp. NPDC057239 TaxID=3346061 RepID=UPI003624F547